MVWHVNEIFETKLAYFDKYMSMERMNKTKYVLGIYNAKCYKLLMSSVFVFWLVNDINGLNWFRCYHTRCDNRHRLLSRWFQLDY